MFQVYLLHIGFIFPIKSAWALNLLCSALRVTLARKGPVGASQFAPNLLPFLQHDTNLDRTHCHPHRPCPYFSKIISSTIALLRSTVPPSFPKHHRISFATRPCPPPPHQIAPPTLSSTSLSNPHLHPNPLSLCVCRSFLTNPASNLAPSHPLPVNTSTTDVVIFLCIQSPSPSWVKFYQLSPGYSHPIPSRPPPTPLVSSFRSPLKSHTSTAT